MKKVGEEFRVSMRNHRRDANERIKKQLKDKQIAEDQSRAALDRIQKMTDEHIEKLDKALKAKEDELMVV